MDFLPFSRPSISEAEIAAVAEVLRSGWITTGPNAAEFESAFADYCGARHAIAVASATAAYYYQGLRLDKKDAELLDAATSADAENPEYNRVDDGALR